MSYMTTSSKPAYDAAFQTLVSDTTHRDANELAARVADAVCQTSSRPQDWSDLELAAFNALVSRSATPEQVATAVAAVAVPA